MKERYVSFEQSQALKRLGFKEEVSHYYCHFKSDSEVKLWSTNPPDNHNARLSTNEVCSAPRIDQAAKWLLKRKGYYIEVPFCAGNGVDQSDGWLYRIVNVISYEGIDCYITYASPEDALSAGISKTLELLGKEENNA